MADTSRIFVTACERRLSGSGGTHRRATACELGLRVARDGDKITQHEETPARRAHGRRARPLHEQRPRTLAFRGKRSRNVRATQSERRAGGRAEREAPHISRSRRSCERMRADRTDCASRSTRNSERSANRLRRILLYRAFAPAVTLAATVLRETRRGPTRKYRHVASACHRGHGAVRNPLAARTGPRPESQRRAVALTRFARPRSAVRSYVAQSMALALLCSPVAPPTPRSRRFVVDLASTKPIEFVEYEWFTDGKLAVSLHELTEDGVYTGQTIVFDGPPAPGSPVPSRVAMRLYYSEVPGPDRVSLAPGWRDRQSSWELWTMMFARLRSGTTRVTTRFAVPSGPAPDAPQYRGERSTNVVEECAIGECGFQMSSANKLVRMFLQAWGMNVSHPSQDQTVARRADRRAFTEVVTA
eukprot:IDg14304t1